MNLDTSNGENYSKLLRPKTKSYVGLCFEEIEAASSLMIEFGYAALDSMPVFARRETWGRVFDEAKENVVREIDEFDRQEPEPLVAEPAANENEPDEEIEIEAPKIDPIVGAPYEPEQIPLGDAMSGGGLLGRIADAFGRKPSVVVTAHGIIGDPAITREIDAMITFEVWNPSSHPIVVRQALISFRKLKLAGMMGNPKYSYEWAMERGKMLRRSDAARIEPRSKIALKAVAPLLPPEKRPMNIDFRDSVTLDVRVHDPVLSKETRLKVTHPFSWSNFHPDS